MQSVTRAGNLYGQEGGLTEEELRASAMLLKEMAVEDHTSYRNCMRMSIAKTEELVQMVGPKIQKRDSVFRTPIPTRMKLEPTL